MQYDLRDEFTNESNFDNNINNNICKCPLIKAKIQGIETFALVDSGSEITCISQEFFESNKKAFENCAILPITGKNIRVAIGDKSIHIKKQILCKFELAQQKEDLIFIIIPALNRDCIIGYDTQKDLKISVFAENDTMVYKNITIPFVSTLNVSEVNFLCTESVSEKHDRCTNHTIRIYDISQDTNSFDYYVENNDENIIFEHTNDFVEDEITMEKIHSKVSNNSPLNDHQKNQLADLIFKYKQVFIKNQDYSKI